MYGSLSVVMARLDRAIRTYMLVLSDGPVEPDQEVNGESQALNALVLVTGSEGCSVRLGEKPFPK